MPSAAGLVVNDELLGGRVGDNLLDVAREHGSHVWFVCDGRGLCRTCACRVIAGGDNLSAPTEIERHSLPEEQRRKGYRLSCQARVIRAGEVRVVSLAEQFRRSLVPGVRREGSPGDDPFFRDLAALAWHASLNAPYTALRMLPQILAMPPSISGLRRYVADSGRVVWRLLGGADAAPAPARSQAATSPSSDR